MAGLFSGTLLNQTDLEFIHIMALTNQMPKDQIYSGTHIIKPSCFLHKSVCGIHALTKTEKTGESIAFSKTII